MSSAVSSREIVAFDCAWPSRSHSPSFSPSFSQTPHSLEQPPAAAPGAGPISGGRAPLDDFLEALPCMAFVECGPEICAVNSLARGFIGTGESLPTEQLFLGAYPAAGDECRQRFECLLLPPGGRPTLVWGAVQPFAPAGPAARLVLLMEPIEGLENGGLGDGRAGKATFLEDLFDCSPEAMVILQGTRIVRANQEFLRLFGYSVEACLGNTLSELIVPEENNFETEMLMHSIAETGRASMETVRRTSSGEVLDVSITVARVCLGADAVGLAVTYRDIRTQKQAEARLKHTSLHDPLTGLANRVLFLDRLTLTMARLMRRPDRNFAVVFLDVDRFKQVNDTYGHAAGDALLLAVTRRLRRCLRPQDTIARFGGDEFALLLDEAGSVDDIARLVQRVQAELQRPVNIGGREAFVSASMGIARGSTSYLSADRIMQDADDAMYRAKANGKARHEFFEIAAQAGTEAASEDEQALGAA
jgi:diguanylate cyclase (GGDEF)-like protein/PAS domain S-box-containing protein